jgi:hypothetical protein
MNVPLLEAAASLLASFALSLDAPAPRLAPEPGLTVQKEVAQTFETVLEGWGCTWNGSEVPDSYLPEIEVEVLHEEAFSVVDEYLACREGRLERLVRRYDEAGGSLRQHVRVGGELQPSSGEKEARSPLEGAVVRFEAGAPRLEAGDVPEELVAGLAPDLDLAAFLPPAGAAPGEPWTVDAKAFSPLGTPGGDLGLALDSEEAPDPAQLAAHLEGEWTARLAGEEPGGDPRLSVEGEFGTWAERATDLAEVPIVDGAATERTEMRLRCVGTIVWSRRASVLGSARIESEVRTTVTTTRDLEGVEGEPTYEQRMRFTGRSTFVIETRPLD